MVFSSHPCLYQIFSKFSHIKLATKDKLEPTVTRNTADSVLDTMATAATRFFLSNQKKGSQIFMLLFDDFIQQQELDICQDMAIFFLRSDKSEFCSFFEVSFPVRSRGFLVVAIAIVRCNKQRLDLCIYIWGKHYVPDKVRCCCENCSRKEARSAINWIIWVRLNKKRVLKVKVIEAKLEYRYHVSILYLNIRCSYENLILLSVWDHRTAHRNSIDNPYERFGHF